MGIRNYQRKCFRQYKETIGYPEERTFLYGNPVEVAVPLEVATGKAMVIGLNPAAKAYEVEGQKEVPLYSSSFPFSAEKYFDGKSVQNIAGSDDLAALLQKLGIAREDCWLSTLIKIYLFNSKDVAKYNKLGNFKVAPDEFNFKEYGAKSMPWIEEEAGIAEPQLIILLGLETISLFYDLSPTKAKHLVDGQLKELRMGRKSFPALCLQDAGLMLNNNKRNPWPEVFENKVLPAARKSLQEFSFVNA
jgi:uracil-DNA glycosylase